MTAPAPEHRPDDRPPQRTRRTASLTEWLWPIAAVWLLAGVTVAAFDLVGHPLAVLVIPAVTALAALMADHYVD